VFKAEDSRYMFSGSALAVSAAIDKPVRDFLTDQTSAVLSSSGGYALQTREHTNFREIIRTGRVSATVIGNDETDHHFVTLATATVENLDILGFIKADAIVSRIAARSRKDDKGGEIHATSFRFEGSAFYGLKINGKHYEPRLCDPCTDYPNDPSYRVSKDKKTCEIADDSNKRLLCKVESDRAYRLLADAVGEKRLFSNVHYTRPRGPFLEFLEFGRIYLGELDIFKGRASLTMLRVEFGCTVGGSGSCATSTTNGHQVP
jgi:hypothetical protein